MTPERLNTLREIQLLLSDVMQRPLPPNTRHTIRTILEEVTKRSTATEVAMAQNGARE